MLVLFILLYASCPIYKGYCWQGTALGKLGLLGHKFGQALVNLMGKAVY